MSIALRCPNGHDLLLNDRLAGKSVYCSHCRAVVRVPDYEGEVEQEVRIVRKGTALPPGPRRDDGDDLPRVRPIEEEELDDFEVVDDAPPPPPRRKRSTSRARQNLQRAQGFSIVDKGLLFHYLRTIAFLIAILLNCLHRVLAILFLLTKSARGGTLLSVLEVLILICVGVAVPILGLVGSILCLWTPREVRAHPQIITSLILDVAVIPLVFGASLMFAVGGLGMLGAAAGPLLGLLSAFVAWIMFMLYLKQLGSYVKDDPSAREAVEIIVAELMLIGVMFMAAIIAGLLTTLAVIVGLIVATAVGFAGAIFLVKILTRQLNLIGTLRQQVVSRT